MANRSSPHEPSIFDGVRFVPTRNRPRPVTIHQVAGSQVNAEDGEISLRRKWRNEQAARQEPCIACGVTPDAGSGLCRCS
jgi:hypothetical protein